LTEVAGKFGGGNDFHLFTLNTYHQTVSDCTEYFIIRQ